MCKAMKKLIKESNAVANQYGCEFLELINGKSHNKMVFINTATGATRFVTNGKTPSDHRAAKNHLKNVKHECMGIA